MMEGIEGPDNEGEPVGAFDLAKITLLCLNQPSNMRLFGLQVAVELPQHLLREIDAFYLGARTRDGERKPSGPAAKLEDTAVAPTQADIVLNILRVILVFQVIQVGTMVGVLAMRHAKPIGVVVGPTDVPAVRRHSRWSRWGAPDGDG